ncbi:MAG TPA: hypothetical protein VMG10_26035 [Gemmataceae bacterium]|nr:hypothetical protein [Gemmataceae bacterium]
MTEKQRVTRRTFVAFEAFQIITALEAEGGTNAGVEKFLPQRFSETPVMPDDGNSDLKQESQVDHEGDEGGHLQKQREGGEAHSKGAQQRQ